MSLGATHAQIESVTYVGQPECTKSPLLSGSTVECDYFDKFVYIKISSYSRQSVLTNNQIRLSMTSIP